MATIHDYIKSSTKTVDELFIELNDKTIEVKRPINTKDIERYLILQDKWYALKTSTQQIADIVRDALDKFDVFDYQQPTVEAKLNQMMDGLITLGIIDANDKAYILSLGIKKISLAEQYGLGLIEYKTIKTIKEN